MKKSSLPVIICACFLIFALLRYPAAMLAASAESASLWFTRVLPSLFPFMAACGLLLRLGAAERLGSFLQPVMKPLFGLPGICAFPFFLGILSGYPMGAKLQPCSTKKNCLPRKTPDTSLFFPITPVRFSSSAQLARHFFTRRSGAMPSCFPHSSVRLQRACSGVSGGKPNPMALPIVIPLPRPFPRWTRCLLLYPIPWQQSSKSADI